MVYYVQPLDNRFPIGHETWVVAQNAHLSAVRGGQQVHSQSTSSLLHTLKNTPRHTACLLNRARVKYALHTLAPFVYLLLAFSKITKLHYHLQRFSHSSAYPGVVPEMTRTQTHDWLLDHTACWMQWWQIDGVVHHAGAVALRALLFAAMQAVWSIVCPLCWRA